MAEFLAEMQERLLPEYEQLKKFEVCTDEQIRECIRKRDSLQLKITQKGKSVRDYADFILFERKVHKWVTEKERFHGNKLTGLKSSIASRIIRLYRDGLRAFPHEERFWDNFINFSKKSAPQEVSGIYEKMLTFYGDKPRVWCDAALWIYEYSSNIKKVKEIFFRALQRHPDSEEIYKTFFDTLLLSAIKMSTQKNAISSDEKIIRLEQVLIVYKNSKKIIQNINFFLSLLERCESEKFLNITTPLQKVIIDDLMTNFPRNEILWDTLAQRELRGYNMSDLNNSMDIKDNAVDGEQQSKDIEKTENFDNDQNLFQKRSLKRRIELCCNVYQTAVRTLETTNMWTKYINAMLKLNQDMSAEKVLKRKCLAIAFKEGHASRLMSVDHYCTYVQMLLESPTGVPIAEQTLMDALKIHKSIKLYELLLSTYIVADNEPKAYETFRTANDELGAQKCVSLWRSLIQFYKTHYNDCGKQLQKLFKEACQEASPDFGEFRCNYLDFCILNFSMQKTRSEYDKLCLLPPPCRELHQKMAALESQTVAKNQADMDRWRLCYVNAVFYFGKTNTQVWIDFIKFEREHGEPKNVSTLYDRAKNTLETELVDNFISEYTLLTHII
ncbi:U3 small nucleolar RNA-associated protein 6 homolog [Teleopsis dalmanni]|uniref:U3 small nucleolar RNA-associated protein 6 homolog n=1 Tax=Teleopsis dalmanni TaxID=139649 RepID=UPI0018CCD99B|nr:U3 small nucleolar RNA-associated protein 6 homolog [Teleopsis dalmanni]